MPRGWSMNPRASSPALAIATLVALLARVAGAQPRAEPAPVAVEEQANAHRQRGLALLRAGEAAGAVQAFERSLALVDSPNSWFDLGRALYLLGRPASALFAFERARDIAQARVAAGQASYEPTARHAAAAADELRARVPTLAVRFSRTPPRDTVITVGGVPFPVATLVAPIPVDPGMVHLSMRGPAVQTQVLAHPVAEAATAHVLFEVQPRGVRLQVPAGVLTRGAPSLVALGYAAGATGLVMLGSGAVLWLTGADQTRVALQLCAPGCNDGMSVRRFREGQTFESVGASLVAGGGAMLAAGVLLWLIGQPARTPSVVLTPTGVAGVF